MIWAIILAICAICSLLNKFLIKNKKLLLPPSPRGWYPIIGHFHLLGKNPHRDLHNLSKEYGPIMYLQFGFVPNIIVSSPHAAEQFLKTHDLVFADRPPHQASKYISYEQRNLSFGKYGSYWRNMRKMCTLHLLSNQKINSFLPMRRQEIDLFVNSLKQSSETETGEVDLSSRVSSLTTNMSCLMVFGKKFEDWEFHERGFKDVMQESMHLSAKPNLGDYFPFIGVLDLQGLTKRMKEMSKIFDLFLEKIIDEHERSSAATAGKDQSKDFVSTMLALMESGDIDFEFDRRHIKAIMLDMLAASMDTSASVIEWLMSELLRQPRLMKKVQNELEQTIGLNRMVSESDLNKLNYLEMVIKETFRLHPPAPLLLPHSAMEDCRVDGYHIPKGSRVIINAWAIARDPKVWSTNDPEKFVPERFDKGGSNDNVDVRGMNFELIPFGSGRRGCPGIQLGLTMVRLVAAQLLHCFDWKLPNNVLPEELDMEEEFGIVVSRARHLMVIPTYRLRL